jgi:hypothetical protein
MQLLTLDQVASEEVRVLSLPYGRGQFAEGASDSVYYEDREGRRYFLSGHAEEQLATRLGIANGYMHKCPGDLRSVNYNYWTRHDGTLSFVSRPGDVEDTYKILATVSPNFTPMDHAVLVNLFREELSPWLETQELTEDNLRLERSWIDDITGELVANLVLPEERQVGARKVGDIVQRGFSLVNDLTRNTIMQMKPYYLRLVCTNGMTAVHGLEGYRWTFRHGPGGYEDEVRTWLKGIIENISGGVWDNHFHQMDALANTPVDAVLATDLIATMGRRFGNNQIAEDVAQYRQAHLVEDETYWDIVNYFTAEAQERLDPEEVLRLEAMGGKIMEDLHEHAFCEMCHRPIN